MPPSLTIASVLGALIGGYLVGIVVNLIADYAPARRLNREAARSPFVSSEAVPRVPPFLPPIHPVYWSGWVAWVSGRDAFEAKRWARRLTVELAIPILYVWLVGAYGGAQRLPFFLFYGPALLLTAVIDIERRWVLNSGLALMGLVALLDVLLIAPDKLGEALRGGLFGFVIMFGLWLLGIAFGQGVGIARGRGVGRTVLGFGDVRLVGVGGLMLGWPGIGFALLIMVFTGAIGAVAVLVQQMRRGRRLRFFAAIPYAPYITLGIAIVLYLPWLVGDVLLRLRR
jgi:leader peptidase (prepilin peptidase)/N-methyltransferase